jgi:hypothetical protein
MNRIAVSVLSVSASMLLSSALAGGSWRAWSDQTKLPTFDEHRKQVGQTRDQACKPQVRDYATPGLAVGGGQDLDEMIKRLEALLATMKPGVQGYEGVKQSIESLKEQKKKGNPPLPLGNAPGALTFQKALANVEKVLGVQASQVKDLASSDDVIASLAGRDPKLALALLLASHRAQPRSAWTLVNAAGVLSMTGFPHEAIAFLDEAARLGGALPAPAGVPGQAIALSNRGHAFLGLGRWKEAETPLRAALKLAPDLAEAHTNLSQALLCQGQLDAATSELRLGLRRTPDPQASKDYALEETTPGRHGAGVKPVEETPRRRPARDLFDLSRGAAFELPQLKLPRTRLEAIALSDQYEALERAGAAEAMALNNKATNLSNWNRFDAGEQRWMRLVREAIVYSHFEPELWNTYKAAWDTHYAFLEAVPRFAKVRNEISERANGLRTCEQRAAVYDEAARAYMEGLRPFVRGQEQAMARWVSLRTRHETALAANIADPTERLALRLGTESRAKALFYGPVVDAALLMSEVPDEVCQGQVAQGSLDLASLPELSADPCGGLTTGGKLKSKVPKEKLPFESYGLSFGVSCKGLDIELAPSFKTAFNVGPFAQLSLGWNGTATVFAGVKAELKQPKSTPLAEYNKSGLSVKEGLYLKFDKDGIADAGMRVEAKVTVGAGPDRTAALWEGKIEQEFGIAAAAAYWREQ